jgi:hypothetical protein
VSEEAGRAHSLVVHSGRLTLDWRDARNHARKLESGMNFAGADRDRHSVNKSRASHYAVTRSPDAADLSMAAMTSWRRTASAKSGTV